ncbi:MAG: hypothetical protein RLZZ156_1664 [Deinococcota bacterium]|jgi:hypothetical protein
MFKITVLALLMVLGFGLTRVAGQTDAACPKGAMNKTLFRGIVQNNYAAPSNFTPDEVTPVLMECLASPDSELRDTYGFEILTRWIRRGVLKPDSLKRMIVTLTPNLKIGIGERGTNTVFRRTFSALILSELVRQDNLTPYLEVSDVKALLEAGVTYLTAEQDLRGFDKEFGYVHGVAHGADVLFRLASSKHLEKTDLVRILEAVRSKVAPNTETSYAFGEDERLARVVIAVLARGMFNLTEWSEYIGKVVAPAPFGSWNDIWFDTAGLAKRHNTKLFLLSLNLYLTLGAASNASDLVSSVQSALNNLP